MCTVTFIPVNDKVFITSNRDEQCGRLQAIAPDFYAMQTGKILFPKDRNAGGTWFAVHENGNTLVLLNGAKVKHIPQPPYRKSRGLILLDMTDSDDPLHVFLTTDYMDIEPFTVIAYCEGNLFEYKWDGKEKWHRRLQEDIPHIWSSVTLYDDSATAKREEWFRKWLLENPAPTQQDVLLFHQAAGDGDSRNDLLMNRDGVVLTVSITSLESSRETGVLAYLDLEDKQHHRREFVLSNVIPCK
jgi:Transport and Golgi organisation 2